MFSVLNFENLWFFLENYYKYLVKPRLCWLELDFSLLSLDKYVRRKQIKLTE